MRKSPLPTLLLGLLISLPALAFPSFNEGRAWEDLLAQCDMGPRNPGSPGHKLCGEWIARSLEDLGYEVERHRFQKADPYGPDSLSLVNIRARMPGADGLPVAFAAHWDTRPRAEMEKEKARRKLPIPGASDGASGVAVLMELARICAEVPPPLPVEFLFFDGEDYGKAGEREHFLLGSRTFVEDHPSWTCRLLLLVDLVGGKNLKLPMEAYSLAALPQEMALIYSLAAELGLPAFLPRRGTAVWDDHVPFLEKGIPAIDLVDLEYRYWHTLEDRPENCSPNSLLQVGTLLLALLYESLPSW
ncbi:MAG: M28 family peptidase [Candidatus Krumholzibacteria bacterium]|jgi:hypothetical protein|nr:M28 family peptidase [Candidatus Krumholzibacteria bacterium]MDP6669958.1 M28 family peptidase [Candidatus Krumholzibacteria bacterium]MDP6797311.1 M28 family peptidase [Candidatus Krumholzibacteria bacterium]MDP7021202.1 M28 family peptidase [Candidatus Krumholzibacteria bacterium]